MKETTHQICNVCWKTFIKIAKMMQMQLYVESGAGIFQPKAVLKFHQFFYMAELELWHRRVALDQRQAAMLQ